MASKLLSFICHVGGAAPGAYPAAAPAEVVMTSRAIPERKVVADAGGHFTAIYENERFVRFKYISNMAN